MKKLILDISLFGGMLAVNLNAERFGQWLDVAGKVIYLLSYSVTFIMGLVLLWKNRKHSKEFLAFLLELIKLKK